MHSAEIGFLVPYFAPAAKGISDSTGVNLSAALHILRQSHDVVSSFCNRYEESISSARARLLAQFQGAQTTALTSETHHGGESVYKVNGDNALVVYSSLRAHPRVFGAAISFAYDLLGIRHSPRAPSRQSRGVALRNYHASSEIANKSKASYASGIVLACAQLTALTDAYSENVIFQDDFPIVIDDECVLQPLRPSQLNALTKNHHEAIYGFSRSLLLPGHTMGPKACGFSALLANGIDIDALISGYCDTASAISKRRTQFLGCVKEAVFLHPWARYLVRSTEYYTLCKRVVGTTIVTRGLCTTAIAQAVKDCFVYEAKTYPELVAFIDDEIAALVSGDTPYYLVHLRSGEIVHEGGSLPLSRIEAPFDWFQKRLPDCFSRITDYGPSDIRAALKLSKKPLHRSGGLRVV